MIRRIAWPVVAVILAVDTALWAAGVVNRSLLLERARREQHDRDVAEAADEPMIDLVGMQPAGLWSAVREAGAALGNAGDLPTSRAAFAFARDLAAGPVLKHEALRQLGRIEWALSNILEGEEHYQQARAAIGDIRATIINLREPPVSPAWSPERRSDIDAAPDGPELPGVLPFAAD